MCTNPLITFKMGDKVLSLDKIRKYKITPWHYQNRIDSKDVVEIKCGKCLECKKQKMYEMKKRIEEQLKINKEAYFLTLTYDNEHEKNLNIRDMQLFFKRYRKKQKIKYFYVGELGEKTKRPHYHAIMFAPLPSDIQESKTETKNGYKQYESKEITKLWGNGLIKISKMEKPLIGYITKYMLKNVDKKEFVSGWSRKPPLGINPETIEEEIIKRDRTKALKNYYKYRNGEIPVIESEKEKQEIKIEQIEKQTKLKYFDYIQKKRQI
jgi:hypothetical protein